MHNACSRLWVNVGQKSRIFFMVLSAFTIVSHTQAVPLLTEPTFTRLSTEQGLTQDTVRTMLLDQQGFLWVGTEGGLNRYDGYQSVPINGANDELAETQIEYIFQDSRGSLWISTLVSGVYELELSTNTLTRRVDLKYSQDPNFIQPANTIFEDETGDIWLGMDEKVLRYSPKTHAYTVVYGLSEELLTTDYIRWVSKYKNTLFIATTTGLLGLDLSTKVAVPIDYLQKIARNNDNTNSKFLLIDNEDNLWIGTVEGLFSMPLQATLNYVANTESLLPKSTQIIAERNIWRMVQTPDNKFFVATDEGLYSYYPDGKQLQQLFLPTDSRDYLAGDALREILIDRNQNFWLGTESDGAIYWSPRTTLFNNVFNARGGRQNKVLSHNQVWSIAQQNEDNLWVGTRNGLNLYYLKSGQTESFMVSADNKVQTSASTVHQIIPDKDQKLWLLTDEGLISFDSQRRQNLPLKIANQNQQAILNKNVFAMHKLPNDDLMLIGRSDFYQYSPSTGEVVRLEQLSSQINPQLTYRFFDHPQTDSNATFVATLGQLWQMDNNTKALTSLHSLPKQYAKNDISPDSVVVDKNNIMWIAYPTYGLVGIDATTHEQKYFYSRNDLLPSNSIYGLQLDKEGNIWMSSHSGLLKFIADTHTIQKFGFEQGLVNLEFNQYSNALLDDGRMVFGSLKGLTIFDPQKLSSKNHVATSVFITQINLNTNKLPLPLTDLSNQTIELQYNDLGLAIHYSTLDFENQRNKRYQVRLVGSSTVSYPISTAPEISFPKLEPGKYRLEVRAFDSIDGSLTEPAIVNIKVNYAPWLSPVAYSAYGVIVLICLSIWWWRRHIHNQRLMTAHEQMVQSKNKLALALSASNSDIWEYQLSDDQFYAPRLRAELGYTFDDDTISFAQHLELVHEQDKAHYESNWRDFLAQSNADLDVSYRMRNQRGEWVWYRDTGSAVKTDEQTGTPILVTGTYTNISDTMLNKENLRLFGEAFKHTHDWVIIFDDKRQAIAANDAFCSAFGIQEGADLAKELNIISRAQIANTESFINRLVSLKANDHWKGEDQIVFSDGTVCDVLVYLNAIANEQQPERIEYYLLILSDISEQKKAEHKLVKLANYDALTGLPNRSLLLDRIERGLEHANRHNNSIAVFFIDLDRFKQVNDSLGHKAGDELLKVIAKRLTDKLRKEDTVARLGGDEFVIMIEDVSSVENISALVFEVSEVIDLPVSLLNQTVSVSSSIGIAMYPGDGKTAEELLRNADIAMYHAKEQGRSNFQFFTAEMDALVKERLALENKLKIAHQQKRFKNYYQPIVNVDKGWVEGFEILMRWPTKNGMIPPDKFIPIAEELGLIEQMTLDAFERAMPVLKSLRLGGFDGYLSVNLSARHFENQSSIDKILLLLEFHEMPVSAIRFEITESALMRDYDKALEFMQQIQRAGFLIALDDFGTGYSSLKYLKEFPISIIKVDKSFVDDIGKNKNNEAIILTTLSMATQLNMSCVAEGIETKEQVTFFNKHQCAHLQGYYFSKPVPAEELPELVERMWY
ncbi:MAG: EAL domain-containing protein [Paraglaciecola sp.]|nr:EAL domain-containing protein [Paraglaciecola sp.]NCT47889.1 EAL domain-containing protein [Paraglaciecola sp.]